MAVIKITNGFPNPPGQGGLLTGILIEGNIVSGDSFIINGEAEVKIIAVELDKTTFPGTTHFAITVPRDLDNKIVWHKLYGQTFQTLKANK